MKYILKKEYPGSPKLGTILTHEELQFCNWNEYYQEVVEKDYEILELSLQRSIKHQIVSALGNSEDYTISLLNCNGNKIHSVKRLSDGEIFTIGDIIDTRVDNKYKQEILEISIKNNTIMFKTKLGFVILSVAKKVKKPLFTTEQRSEIEEIIKNIIK